MYIVNDGTRAGDGLRNGSLSVMLLFYMRYAVLDQWHAYQTDDGDTLTYAVT